MNYKKVQKANFLFKNEDYEKALNIYKEISSEIGENFFKVNIFLCNKRMIQKKKIKSSSLDKINIAFITDENFIIPTYVSIYSILENRDLNMVYDIYVLVPSSSIGLCDFFKKINVKNVNIIIVGVDCDYNEFEIDKNGFHVSPFAICKFNIPNILSGIDKVLYLDGDIVVNSSLFDMFCIDVESFYAAVVADMKPVIKYKPNILIKLRIEHHRAYFNSGVMLLNLKKMRQDDISQQLFEYRRSGINFFMDQDALNVVFKDKVKYLSLKNNFLMTLCDEFCLPEVLGNYELGKHYNSFDELIKSSAIIHFASKRKPWVDPTGKYSCYWSSYYFLSNVSSYDKYCWWSDKFRKEIIVSLTSYPARIKNVHYTIKSLLKQKFRPFNVHLWLAEDQFPNKEQDLPLDLLELKKTGLFIEWCHDIRSYKKLIPALNKYSDSIIITVDDDIIYHEKWFSFLFASYVANPKSIHCCRAHAIMFDSEKNILPYGKWIRNIKSNDESFSNFFTGCGGVLYPPGCLHPTVDDENVFSAVCPDGDDIWFWGMAVLNGTKIQVVKNFDFELNFIPESQEVSLWKINDVGGQNDIALSELFKMFPEIKTRAYSDYVKRVIF